MKNLLAILAAFLALSVYADMIQPPPVPPLNSAAGVVTVTDAPPPTSTLSGQITTQNGQTVIDGHLVIQPPPVKHDSAGVVTLAQLAPGTWERVLAATYMAVTIPATLEETVTPPLSTQAQRIVDAIAVAEQGDGFPWQHWLTIIGSAWAIIIGASKVFVKVCPAPDNSSPGEVLDAVTSIWSDLYSLAHYLVLHFGALATPVVRPPAIATVMSTNVPPPTIPKP